MIMEELHQIRIGSHDPPYLKNIGTCSHRLTLCNFIDCDFSRAVCLTIQELNDLPLEKHRASPTIAERLFIYR